MNKFSARLRSMVFAGTIFLIPALSWANNLSVSNVTLGARDAAANTVVVKFNITWENSWRNKINHDAVWLTLRLNDANASYANKNLCRMSLPGLNPAGFSVGTQSGLEFYVPTDRYGAFLRRSENASVGSIASQDLQVIVDYSSCGFSSNDQIKASIFGLEMVLIPQGTFYAGDNDASVASFDQGSADADAWFISNEAAISVSNPVANGYRYVSNSNPGENATGSTFTVAASFPKGYQSFYVMKYELTQGQWVEFINSLPSAARSQHDLTDNLHKNSDAVLSRNAISCSGSPLICLTDRPWRAVNYLSWMDLAAFLDWAALRPITELEFEKISRGPMLPINSEYAWGSADIIPAATISGSQENGIETITNTNANVHFDNMTLSGGDAAQGVEYQKGPLLVGIFATPVSTRATAGAGYYGVLDLSGNLAERVVTIGNAAGRNFTGAHGDGILSAASGYEGNADVTAWPGLDAVVLRGVTGAEGSALRGGSWVDVADRLRISDRFEGALTSTQALNTYGGRGARTYDGN